LGLGLGLDLESWRPSLSDRADQLALGKFHNGKAPGRMERRMLAPAGDHGAPLNSRIGGLT
jgi:hypothetical protein